jgi:hypothetical protein
MDLYLLVGVLVFVLIISICGNIYMLIQMNKTNSSWNQRMITSDRHHTAKERFLTFLLLESKGLNTGVGSSAKLYREYLSELVKDKALDDFEKAAILEETKEE